MKIVTELKQHSQEEGSRPILDSTNEVDLVFSLKGPLKTIVDEPRTSTHRITTISGTRRPGPEMIQSLTGVMKPFEVMSSGVTQRRMTIRGTRRPVSEATVRVELRKPLADNSWTATDRITTITGNNNAGRIRVTDKFSKKVGVDQHLSRESR